MEKYRVELDSIGEINVEASKLWGAQTQRSLEHFCIGNDLMPREMIKSYAYIKKACALVNVKTKKLNKEQADLIIQVCDELLSGKHHDMFPLHVWMTGSGTQFNMNVNEVISNRCCQIAGTPLGSKSPIHPNDHVNMSQSSNDSFPTAMNIATIIAVKNKLLPKIAELKSSFAKKSEEYKDIVKIGRTHLQDATPLTLGQEMSGYTAMLDDAYIRIERALTDVYKLTLGGTAVGTGINTLPDFATEIAAELANLTSLPLITSPNKFATQGAHDGLVELSASLKSLAVSIFKIANDIRLLSCGPRAGIGELILPSNEPGSSIMPGKVNPTQCEAITMVSLQVMANDFAVSLGGASGYLEMNVYKPLMIFNIMNSINIMSDSLHNFKTYAIDGLKANIEKISEYVDNSLMLVTALSPVIGYDKSSQIAHYALDNNLTLKEAALKLGFVSEDEYNNIVQPAKMVYPQKIK